MCLPFYKPTHGVVLFSTLLLILQHTKSISVLQIEVVAAEGGQP